MQIQLIDGRISATPGMLEFVQSQITAAVGRFASRIRAVRVRIADVNGPPHRGGLDKRCVILATVNGRGAGGGEVIVRHGHSDFYAAIAGAAYTLKRRVSRRIDRGHMRRHGRR